MTRTDRRLLLALTLSLALHLLPLLPAWLAGRPAKAAATPPLQAMLRPLPPPAPLAEQPPLSMPETATPPSARRQPPARERKPGAQPRTWQEEVRRQLSQQQRRGEFYPPEAIARGLQGEVLVLLMLAPDGSVAAARVEQGSGHPLLDQAALRAVRALRSLPADAPRETLLPVRFVLQ